VSVFDEKVGRWRRSRQETLGSYQSLLPIILLYLHSYNSFVLQNKFAAFCQYAKTFNSDAFDYDKLKNADHVFMRWKEHFLVPDHTIRDISGASFAGFYYICFQKSTSSIEGYYYHRSSEWWDIVLLIILFLLWLINI